jgi:glycerate kinase
MRILIATDKFKGSMTASEAGEAVRRGLKKVFPDAEIDVCPVADGGEGTTESVVSALNGRVLSLDTQDARGRKISAQYGMLESTCGLEAVMEMSATAGLVQVSDLPLDPAVASTRGTGEMIRHAVISGAQRIIIGIGGSATNDGGVGMAQALGFDFLDAEGRVLIELPRNLEKVRSIRRGPAFKCEMRVACDVRNPLLGERGATRVYGAQKGVVDFDFFEDQMESLANLVRRDLGSDFREVPGAGAAGGLGFGLMSFCGAELVSGFDLIASLIGLRERIATADLVITGEGKLDGQSLEGKGPVGVAQWARAAGKKVIGLAGGIDSSEELEAVFDLLLQIKPEGMSVADAMAAGAGLLEEKVVQSADLIRELRTKEN